MKIKNKDGGFFKQMENNIKEFEKALLQINRKKAIEIFEECYVKDSSFGNLENLVIYTLEKIGDGWEDGRISLSQVYMSGIICEELMDKYVPKIDIQRKKTPIIAIGVLQDHHALGKRIVCSVLRAGGYEVLDFGQGLSVDEMVEKTIKSEAEFLLISTLMLSSALKVAELKKKMIENNNKVTIIVGGAPFRLDKELWKEVGADADGKNATNIIKTVEKLIEGGCL